MCFIHGNNILQKQFDTKHYGDDLSKIYLQEISTKYNEWKTANLTLKGPSINESEEDHKIIEQRVTLLNNYKNFLDQQKYAEKFDSRSNLHSSVLEEFMYYLFKDLVNDISTNALLGKSKSFKDLFFRPKSFNDMLANTNIFIEEKDHDFAIGVCINAKLSCKGSTAYEDYVFNIPAVAIECKTYLDKTMLQDVSTAAEQLKLKNPNSIYIVVSEWLKLTESINIKKYKIDQIYILRKQKNTDRELRFDMNYHKNPIYSDVVAHCFNHVRSFLTSDWGGTVTEGLERGYLL